MDKQRDGKLKMKIKVCCSSLDSYKKNIDSITDYIGKNKEWVKKGSCFSFDKHYKGDYKEQTETRRRKILCSLRKLNSFSKT